MGSALNRSMSHDPSPANVPLPADRPAARSQTTPHHPTVMVVDDCEDNRFMLRYLLEARGYRVIEAADGLEAVTVTRRERPDLILMDLSLPKLDGLSATRRIREDASLRDIPIVAVSGHVRAEDKAGAFAAGCCGYLIKPIDFDQLYELLNRLLPIHPHAASLT